MWPLLPRRLQLFCIVVPTIVIVLAIDAAIDIAGGEQTNPLKYASLVVFVIGAFCIPLANYLWRPVWRCFPVIERFTFPDLNGMWKGQLITARVDPNTEISPPSIPATAQITQSLFSATVRIRTSESRSYSTRCHFEADRSAGVYRVWYSYDNRPKSEVSYRSVRHEGIAWLEVDIGEDRDQLVGQYFTERRTAGDMNLRRVTSSSPL